MTDVFIYTALKTHGMNNVLLYGHITTSFTKVNRKLHKLDYLAEKYGSKKAAICALYYVEEQK